MADHTTTRHIVQFRVYLGPRWLPDSAAAFWDWSALTLAAYTPSPSATTLTYYCHAGDVAITLDSVSGWPSAGGCWIGPYTAAQAWEYVTFTGKSGNDLTGLGRETIDVEQTGDHSAGAAVRFWWPLTTDDGQFTISETLDSALAVVDWEAQLSGFTFPQAAIRNGHLALVQMRWWVTGDVAWGDWTNALIGWLDGPQMRSDATGENTWQARIVSIAGVMGNQNAYGIRVGGTDLAKAADWQASSTQSVPYLLAGWAGEFTAAAPDLGVDALTDGKTSTGWISAVCVGANNQPDLDARWPNSYGIDQVHTFPYTGQGRGYRWVQVPWWGGVEPNQMLCLINHLGYFPQITNWERVNKPYLPFTGFQTVGEALIVCENAQLFQEQYPECTAPLLEVNDGTTWCRQMSAGTWPTGIDDKPPTPITYTVAQWWDSLSATGGGLYVLYDNNGWQTPGGGIIWGNVTEATCEAMWGSSYTALGTTFQTWTGAVLSAPSAGQTFRRKWSESHGGAATSWTTANLSLPGYFADADTFVWLAAELPGMGLTLTDDITAGAPGAGDTLEISLNGWPGVDGLDAAGTVQVGSEQITYSAKASDYSGVTVTARGVNGTVAASHTAGDTIYQVVGGVALDCLPVASIVLTWDAATPIAEDFIIRAAAYTTVRLPGDDWLVGTAEAPAGDTGYQADWTTLATVTGNADNPYTLTLGSPTRYKQLLIEIQAMSTDPYPASLNTVTVAPDTSVYRADINLASTTAGLVIQQVLRNAGIPSGAVSVTAGTATLTDQTTAQDGAWSVVADLAAFAGARVTVGRDSKVAVVNDPYWSIAGVPAETMEWTTLYAGAIEPDFANGLAVGQLELEWTGPTGDTAGIARYPTTPDSVGRIQREGPLYYANATAALAAATKRYWQARRPYGILLEAVGAPWTTRPGQVHGVQWQIDSTMLALNRSYMVTGVDHQIAGGALTSAVNVLQISREDER